MLEKTLENPLDSKEIKSVYLKGNQPQIFIGKTDAKAEAPIIWPPNVKSSLEREKTLMLGKIKGNRGRQRMRWLAGITNSIARSLSKLQDREAWCAAVHGVAEWEMTYRVHMLKPCLECLEPLAGPQAQGPWP